ncbi:hypothetical protein Q9189_005759 [Teloschistes chrysophthalmus]
MTIPIVQISSWKTPRDAVSLFSAKIRGLKNRLKAWSRIKKGTVSVQFDNEWESSDWETESWDPTSLHPRDYKRFTPKLLDFIAPLQKSSLSEPVPLDVPGIELFSSKVSDEERVTWRRGKDTSQSSITQNVTKGVFEDERT